MDWFSNGMLAAAKRKGGGVALSDPFFHKAVLIHNYETLTDHSLTDATFTLFGAANLSGGRLHIGGVGDYIDTTSMGYALVGDTTVEAIINLSSGSSGYRGIISSSAGASLEWIVTILPNGNLAYYASGGVYTDTGIAVPTDVDWHFAISVSGETLKVAYGTPGTEGTVVANNIQKFTTSTATGLTIGRNGFNSTSYNMVGSFKGIRITAGQARYMGATYNAPMSFSEFGEDVAVDPMFSDVLFVANYNKNSTADVRGHTSSLYNGAVVGAGHLHLDGSNDYLSMPFEIVTQDVCIEGWFILDNWVGGGSTNGTGIESIWEVRIPNMPGMVFYRIGTTLYLHVNGQNIIAIIMPAYTNGTPVHIAVQIQRNFLAGNIEATIWWNGTRVANAGLALGHPYNFIDGRVIIGQANSFIYPLDGHISSFRITGTVRYPNAPTITVPDMYFPETGPASDPHAASVVFAANMNFSMTDSTGRHTISTIGATTSTSSTQQRSGVSSWYGPGDGALEVQGNLGDFDLSSGDATIEFSYYPTTSGNQMIMSARDDVTTGFGWHIIYASSILYFQCGNTGNISSGQITLNAWNDIAIDISGSTTFMRVNGVVVAQGNVRPTDAYASALRIGRGHSTPYFLTGYLDEIRITKGVSRHPLYNYYPRFPFLTTQALLPTTVSLMHFDNEYDVNPARSWLNYGVTFGSGGIFGNQASFDGSSYMECTDPAIAIGVNEAFTLQGHITVVPPGNATQIAFGIGTGVGSDYIVVYYNTNTLFLATYGTRNDPISGWSISTPFFFAMVGRTDGTYDVYVNNNRVLTNISRAGAATTARIEFGRGFWNQSSKWNGKLDEFKLSKVEEYSGATITIPTAPFSG